jgi:hypothetical protein
MRIANFALLAFGVVEIACTAVEHTLTILKNSRIITSSANFEVIFVTVDAVWVSARDADTVELHISIWADILAVHFIATRVISQHITIPAFVAISGVDFTIYAVADAILAGESHIVHKVTYAAVFYALSVVKVIRLFTLSAFFSFIVDFAFTGLTSRITGHAGFSQVVFVETFRAGRHAFA